MRTSYPYQQFSSGKQAKGMSLERQGTSTGSLAAHRECHLNERLTFRDKNKKKGELEDFFDAR